MNRSFVDDSISIRSFDREQVPDILIESINRSYMRDDLSCLHAVDGPRMHFNLLGSLSDDYDSVEISLSSYCWVRIFNDVHYCELLVLIVLGTAFCHLCFLQCKHFFHS